MTDQARTPEVSGRIRIIADFIRHHRGSASREAIDRQLGAAGHAREDIAQAWAVVDVPPEWPEPATVFESEADLPTPEVRTPGSEPDGVGAPRWRLGDASGAGAPKVVPDLTREEEPAGFWTGLGGGLAAIIGMYLAGRATTLLLIQFVEPRSLPTVTHLLRLILPAIASVAVLAVGAYRWRTSPSLARGATWSVFLGWVVALGWLALLFLRVYLDIDHYAATR